ncbi:MAG: NAD-dependent epimerase/dehydratase family protein [Rhodobacteraceae bacterium]|nr:MAG: NAD-dependent epimerase/dehydratase family protein [Paracoccaceae bacterium]
MLQRHWQTMALRPCWQYRRPVARPDSAVFDPLCPDVADVAALGAVDVVLGLAGITPGRGNLELNTALARAAVQIGARTGAARVFVTSSAAVYGPADTALHEDLELHPHTPYGHAKAAMEAALRDSDAPYTVLRIGNVAGADALLDQPGPTRVLDRFPNGQGPLRSYIGPRALADILAGLVTQAAQGRALPERLNIALPGAVAMADLCAAAGLGVAWRPAPADALARVELDVSRLGLFHPLVPADAAQIVAQWRTDRALV